MKNIFIVLFLFLFLFTKSYSGETGTGNIGLSNNVISEFHYYIKQPANKPVKFLVTEDGKKSMSWFCPYTKCAPTGSKGEEKICKRRTGKNCYVFALKRTVRWKNDITKNISHKDRKFSSNMDLASVKAKLSELGFIENDTQIEKKEIKAKIKIKDKIEDTDIVEKIKELNNLFKTGVLTEEEFNKAKKKLLN
jgi:hypothetical protein